MAPVGRTNRQEDQPQATGTPSREASDVVEQEIRPDAAGTPSREASDIAEPVRDEAVNPPVPHQVSLGNEAQEGHIATTPPPGEQGNEEQHQAQQGPPVEDQTTSEPDAGLDLNGMD